MLVGRAFPSSVSLDDYLRAFVHASTRVRLRKYDLLPNERRHVGVHLRRGDRGGGDSVPSDIIRQVVPEILHPRVAARMLATPLPKQFKPHHH